MNKIKILNYIPLVYSNFTVVRMFILIIGFSLVSVAISQEQEEYVIDQVVAVVGKSVILESDV